MLPSAQTQLPSCLHGHPSSFYAGLEHAADDGTSGGGGGEEAGEGQEGIEGVDWRYGSVEELDPSEWQVGATNAQGGRAQLHRFGQQSWWLDWLQVCLCTIAYAASRPQHAARHAPGHPVHRLQVPPHCIPIHANVTTYDWSRLIASTQVSEAW